MRRFGLFLPAMALLAAAIVVLATPPPARADFKVRFTYMGAVITLDDTTSSSTATGGATLSGATVTYTAGKITVNNLVIDPNGTSDGNTAGYSISATIATSNSPGSPFVAKISESGLNIMNQSGVNGLGLLTIDTTSTDFVSPGLPKGFLTSTVSASADGLNGTTASLTFNSYLDSTNAEFGTQQGTPTIGPLALSAGNSVSGNTFATVNVATPYSLSQTELISLNNGDLLFDGSSGTSLTTPAPPGLALALAGLPFVALGWLRRRRQAA